MQQSSGQHYQITNSDPLLYLPAIHQETVAQATPMTIRIANIQIQDPIHSVYLSTTYH